MHARLQARQCASMPCELWYSLELIAHKYRTLAYPYLFLYQYETGRINVTKDRGPRELRAIFNVLRTM